MNKTLSTILIILFFLNLGDAFTTYYWIVLGLAEELNPIALMLININPNLFLLVKCLFGSLSLLVLWLFRKKHKKIVMTVAVFWFLFHIVILAYHIQFIIDCFIFS